MELERNDKEMVTCQVSLGGFDEGVSAKQLSEYLEDNIGLVWRCRLKTSWTPPESYPDFEIGEIDRDKIQLTDDYQKVPPHAFVHFALPQSTSEIMNAAGRCELLFDNKVLRASLGPENLFFINKRRNTTTPFKLTNVRVEAGALVSRNDFFVAWKGPTTGVDFLVDPFDRTCKLQFTKETLFAFKSTAKHAVIKCDFKMEFLVRDINEVKEYTDPSSLIVLLQLASSPSLYYRTADDDVDELVSFDLLDDDDPWIRTTDFTLSGAIGRCSCYRLSLSPRHRPNLRKAMEYLREQSVLVEQASHKLTVREEPDYGACTSDPFFCIQHKQGIDHFEILFLVNAVLHKGIINQHQLTERFYALLKSQPPEISAAALKHIYSYKRPLFDAYKRLELVQRWILKNPELIKTPKRFDDISEVRRLIITPTKAYCMPPEFELSNRVLRHFKQVSDRFLRVTFMDEGMQSINANVLNYYVSPIVKDITSNSFAQKTTIFRRVKSILNDGFYLCGRKYSFLAFSSNQLRDRSAWFFAEDSKVSVVKIKRWMGKFTNKNIAKCSARMGQCFSSTYATVEVPDSEVTTVDDIERNGYVFSDGIGMITPDLAKEVAEKLKLDLDPPCAYQIRYAGCKGVVACWPGKNDGIRLTLRGSMDKFQSNHIMLEICSWARYQPGFLNRQIITLLSTLGVADNIFWKMQQSMVFKLNQMTVDADIAFDVLTSSCAEQGNIAAIMLSAGFKPNTEPHLRGMLTCIRAAQLTGLREKARIFVDSGRWLIGCLDEAAVLEQGKCFVQVSTPSLENCFSGHGSKFMQRTKKLQVVKGYVAVAKNPCLHPGDIRILEAVDDPKLHHLVDCVVFPQKGERPHTNEASGSDLDGDLYFVAWDVNLIPPSKKSSTPMQYDSAEAKVLPRVVTQKDIIEFFVKNMVNENLGAICNAHVVHADRSEYGALDQKCITLAELAATAVDFPKTGKIVTMPAPLKPKQYPDFMGKLPSQSYKSDKILGKMYRQIVDIYKEDESTLSDLTSPEIIPYDTDLEVLGSSDFISDAWNQKCYYDGQLNGLRGQYKIHREEEIVTGHVWSMPKVNSRKQGELKEKLKHAYSVIKKDFRKTFETLDPGFEKLNDDDKNKVYEKKASAWYQVTYHPQWVKKAMEMAEPDSDEEKVMLSFAWITADYLARIKIKRKGKVNGDSSKPINSLAKYLADRM